MLNLLLTILVVYVIACYVWGGYVAARLWVLGRKRRRPIVAARRSSFAARRAANRKRKKIAAA